MLVVLSCANGTKSANGANKPITEILTDQEVVYNQENHPEVFNRLYECADHEFKEHICPKCEYYVKNERGQFVCNAI